MFHLLHPVMSLLKRPGSADQEHSGSTRLDLLSSYLAEMTLLEYQFLHFLPSMIAASAVMLAQYCLNGAGWNPTLWHYTSYSARELRYLASYPKEQSDNPMSLYGTIPLRPSLDVNAHTK